MSRKPELTYPSIKLNGKSWTSGGRASFQAGFNQLVFTYHTDISLNYIEARVTKVNDEYGIGIGVLADSSYGAISANEDHTLTVNINSKNFTKGDGEYLIGIYGKSALDGVWSETLFYITAEGLNFIVKNDQQYNVLTDQLIPQDAPI